MVYGNNDWRDYLAHYGVKGMEWGEHKYKGIVDGNYIYDSTLPVLNRARKAIAKFGQSNKKGKKSRKSGKGKKSSKTSSGLGTLVEEKDINLASEYKKSDGLKEEKGIDLDKEAKRSSDADEAISKTAKDVISGKYGVGEDRKKTIEKMGLSYNVIQNKVNEMLGSKKRHAVSEEDMKKVDAFLASRKSSSSGKKSSGKKSSNNKKSSGKKSSNNKKSSDSKKNKDDGLLILI